MSMLNSLILNSKRIKKINDTHEAIAEMFEDLTLKEVLIVGYNWPREKIERVVNDGTIKKLKTFFKTWDYDNSKRQLSSFKLYNQPAITRHAKYRVLFLQKAEQLGIDLDRNDFTIKELESLAVMADDCASTIYAIKCYIIANFTSNQWKQYKGYQPLTTPVYNAINRLFNINETTRSHKKLCNDLAKELKLSSIEVNTAFYTFG